MDKESKDNNVLYNGKYYYGTPSAMVVGTTKPATTKISLAAGKKYAKISWSKVTRASGYEVFMAKPGCKYSKIATVSSASSRVIYKKNLTSKKYYYF